MAFIDQGEFEAMKTLSGLRAPCCDKHQFCAKMMVITQTVFVILLLNIVVLTRKKERKKGRKKEEKKERKKEKKEEKKERKKERKNTKNGTFMTAHFCV